MLYLFIATTILGFAVAGRLKYRLNKAQIQRVRDKHEIRVQAKTIAELGDLLTEAQDERDGHVNVVAMLMEEIEQMGPRAPRALPPSVRHQIVAGEVVS